MLSFLNAQVGKKKLLIRKNAWVRGLNQNGQDCLEECGEKVCACRERDGKGEQLKEGEQRGKYKWNLTEAHPQQPQVSLGEKRKI